MRDMNFLTEYYAKKRAVNWPIVLPVLIVGLTVAVMVGTYFLLNLFIR